MQCVARSHTLYIFCGILNRALPVINEALAIVAACYDTPETTPQVQL